MYPYTTICTAEKLIKLKWYTENINTEVKEECILRKNNEIHKSIKCE
jgi:hypothetical protein